MFEDQARPIPDKPYKVNKKREVKKNIKDNKTIKKVKRIHDFNFDLDGKELSD